MIHTHRIHQVAFAALLSVGLAACNSDGHDHAESSGAVELADDTAAFEISAADTPTMAEVGTTAPNFALRDLEGNRHKLSDHRGKIVVLEWYNPKCPFVVYAHGEDGPLRDMPNRWMDEGVVWMAINSGAPGKQGTGTDLNLAMRDEYAIQYPILIDETGEVGRKYQAKTTPHMYVIDAEGTLVYAGGLDNAGFGKVSDGGEMRSYVEEVLEDLAAGKEPRVQSSKPYGCSVKYAK